MTINAELYQDTGAVTSSHGTTRISVINVGYKSNGLDETNSFVMYPLSRPTSGVFGYSYKQYNYFKVSGTFAKASRPRIQITNNILGAAPNSYQASNGGVRLFYKLSSTYAVPDNNFDGTMIYLPNGASQILYPQVSTTGPEAATGYSQWINTNTTFYTQYLITQVYVENEANGYPANGVGPSPYGNLGSITLKFYCDEYETTDV